MLGLNRTIGQDPYGAIVMTRDSKILYLKDVNPKDIDFVSIAMDILQEVPEHITMNMHMWNLFITCDLSYDCV